MVINQMNLKLSKAFVWNETEGFKRVVTMFFINGIPFTWDELTEEEERSYSPTIAANTHQRVYTPEDLFKASGYLIMEECHPCFFELELENPELLAELDD
tara:strand:- start:216 stop:515 length:300 start_codon:yes stop_codon:yes gene_type:complete